jgi:hypothetical protein
MQVAVRDIETAGYIIDSLAEIVRHLGRWNKYLELFEEFERVREVASHLFSQVINFLIRARIYYGKRQYSKISPPSEMQLLT